ncbi:MAG: DUF4234 domain-containing protein [Thermoleophilia bacterium]|nr:DUF4234 domain-containing protein [Thermoleophilia bacterium]
MAVQERGPVGNTRSVPLSMLWYILTLGIYGLVWAYRTHEEMKRYSGNGLGGVLGLVVWLVASIVSVFVIPSEIRYLYEDLDGGAPGSAPVRGLTGLWVLIPIAGAIVWFVKCQGALNRYWESKGAPPA